MIIKITMNLFLYIFNSFSVIKYSISFKILKIFFKLWILFNLKYLLRDYTLFFLNKLIFDKKNFGQSIIVRKFKKSKLNTIFNS